MNRLHLVPRDLLVATLAALLLTSAPVSAQETDEATTDAAEEAAAEEAEALAEVIRVIQQRPLLRANRLELQTFFGLGLADTMFRHMAGVANARFNFTERWSLGATGAYYFPDTHGYDTPLSTTSNLFDDVTTTFELFPEKSVIEWFVGLDAGFIPIDGKFALFDRNILYFDFYIIAGLGVLQTSRSSDIKVAGQVGLGWRLYLARWIAMTMEVRDHLYVENYNAGDEFVNHVMFQVGLSWWFPFDFEYRFPR